MESCGVAISNVLSLLSCFLELMFYSGTVWGFSFLEYIFKEEKIFEKEKCEDVDPAGTFKYFFSFNQFQAHVKKNINLKILAYAPRIKGCINQMIIQLHYFRYPLPK